MEPTLARQKDKQHPRREPRYTPLRITCILGDTNLAQYPSFNSYYYSIETKRRNAPLVAQLIPKRRHRIISTQILLHIAINILYVTVSKMLTTYARQIRNPLPIRMKPSRRTLTSREERSWPEHRGPPRRPWGQLQHRTPYRSGRGKNGNNIKQRH